jgi:ABC-2 type transport system permease protein
MRAWWRSYFLLLRWQLLRLRTTLPALLVLDAVATVGIVVGLSFLIPNINAESGLYLTTGAMTISLITTGMVTAPQQVSFQKLIGVFDYQRSMPVPRLAMVAADTSIWLAKAIPGLVLAATVATLRFDLDLTTSPLVIPAVLLVAAGGVAIGYGIAYTFAPGVVASVTSLVLVMALMFAPVNYPAERLPDWAATIHSWLPFQYMAQAVRETVDVPTNGVPVLPFIVIAGWAAIGLAITARVMTRRT